MKDKRKRHISKMIRFLMTVLTSVLIVLILIIILMVSRIQGTLALSIMQDWYVEKHSELLNWKMQECRKMK